MGISFALVTAGQPLGYAHPDAVGQYRVELSLNIAVAAVAIAPFVAALAAPSVHRAFGAASGWIWRSFGADLRFSRSSTGRRRQAFGHLERRRRSTALGSASDR
jgi:hypothetical protein